MLGSRAALELGRERKARHAVEGDEEGDAGSGRHGDVARPRGRRAVAEIDLGAVNRLGRREDDAVPIGREEARARRAASGDNVGDAAGAGGRAVRDPQLAALGVRAGEEDAPVVTVAL